MPIIPFSNYQLRWHLTNNVFGLSLSTIDHIINTCNTVNTGELLLTDDLTGKSGVSVYEMLSDLKIEHNA